jgi:putative tryptophan/tyrosine transport system substrate-binding protein
MMGTGRWSRRQVVQGAGTMGLGLLAGCGRSPGQAQPSQPAPRLGWLLMNASEATASNVEAFWQAMRELGYREGQNVVAEYRYADGQVARFPELAAELVALPVDIILAAATAARAARSVTSTLPIVMVYPGDPMAAGLVASIARPGGNVTGLTTFTGQLQEKRLDLLRETVPGLSRVAMLYEESFDPDSRFSIREVAQNAGVHLEPLVVREPGDVQRAFELAARAGADALLLGRGGFSPAQRSQIVELAAQHKLPAMYYLPEWVHEGGLMAYVTNPRSHWRRAAYYVDRILKGAKPADLPVEQPREFDFVINLKTAQALGITIPQHVLYQATEVIQ